ncbi:hypothetical protein D3C73_1272990 [compost metagenome]
MGFDELGCQAVGPQNIGALRNGNRQRRAFGNLCDYIILHQDLCWRSRAVLRPVQRRPGIGVNISRIGMAVCRTPTLRAVSTFIDPR